MQLPQSLEGCQKLTVYADMPDRRICWFSVSARELEKRRGKPQFFIEEEKVQQGFLRIRGWAVADEPVKIQIFDAASSVSGRLSEADRVCGYAGPADLLVFRFCKGTGKKKRKASVFY